MEHVAAFREQPKGLGVFEFVQAHGAFQRDHAVFFYFRVNEGWERVDYRRVKAGGCKAAEEAAMAAVGGGDAVGLEGGEGALAADAVSGQDDGDAAYDDNEGAYEKGDCDGPGWVAFDLVVGDTLPPIPGQQRRVSLRGRVRGVRRVSLRGRLRRVRRVSLRGRVRRVSLRNRVRGRGRGVSLCGRVRRMEGQCNDEKEDGPNDGAMRGGKELNHNTSF